MSDTSHTYPGIDDWDAYVRGFAPSMCLAGYGGPFLVALSRPSADRELVLEGVARELADLESAGRYVLEARGALYGVDAAGLGLEELRRLVVGARAAMASTGTDADIYAAWVALTGSTDVRVRTIGVTAISLALEARISWIPSSAWLRAAGRIVARLPEAGTDFAAVVHVGGVLRWGALSPGWGVGTWGYVLPRP